MYTYIIVDDELLTRQGTLKKLSPMSDTITCTGQAENGQDALALIAEQNPDIIITDMQMPVMDGTQLLQYLPEHYPDKQIIVISGFKDFDYMKHAISANAVDYILKPFSQEEIQKAVTSAVSKLEKKEAIRNQILSSEEEKEAACYEYDIQMLKNLLLGYHTASHTLTSRQLNYINDTHNLILIALHCSQSIMEADVKNYLYSSSFKDVTLYLPHLNNQHLGFILLFIPEKSPLTSKRLSVRLFEESIPFFEEKGGITSFGISQVHTDFKTLHEAYRETSHALNSQKIASPASACYFYDEAVSPSFIQWENTDEFLFRLEAGMSDEVKHLIDQLFSYYSVIPDCTLNDVKYHCYQLTDQVRTIMNYYLGQSVVNTESPSMQNIVNGIFSLDMIQSYYQQFFVNISELLKPKSIYAVDDVIERMKIYVTRNYQKKLSEDFLSSLFYMNRSYCSHLFRQKTGEKFVDYINQVRITKSKELLLSSDKKMYQIAKAVGYDNVKYFFRVFKKLTGVTPEQFRTANNHSR